MHKFLGASFHSIVFAWAVASLSLQLLAIAHFFKTLSSDQFDGLSHGCFVGVWFLFYEISLLKCVLARWLLSVFKALYVWNRKWWSFLVPKTVIWEAWCLHFGTLGSYFGILGHPG